MGSLPDFWLIVGFCFFFGLCLFVFSFALYFFNLQDFFLLLFGSDDELCLHREGAVFSPF
jgi:hypothetical protein